MRISKLVLRDFRGWEHLDLRPSGHVLLAGVPRSGRSDIIAAICRVLDPESVRLHPVFADLRQYAASDDVRHRPTRASSAMGFPSERTHVDSRGFLTSCGIKVRRAPVQGDGEDE